MRIQHPASLIALAENTELGRAAAMRFIRAGHSGPLLYKWPMRLNGFDARLTVRLVGKYLQYRQLETDAHAID